MATTRASGSHVRQPVGCPRDTAGAWHKIIRRSSAPYGRPSTGTPGWRGRLRPESSIGGCEPICATSTSRSGIPPNPVEDEYHGHEGLRRWATEVWEVFSELHNEVEEIIKVGDGDTLVSVQKTHARMRHTELETHFRWAVVWRLKDGKALSAHGYLTKAEALDAAGAGG